MIPRLPETRVPDLHSLIKVLFGPEQIERGRMREVGPGHLVLALGP